MERASTPSQMTSQKHLILYHTWHSYLQYDFLLLVSLLWYYLGHAVRKRVYGHMQTANAQIRLRIRASDQGLRCPLTESFGHYRMYQWRANARMRLCACGMIWICAICAWSKTHFRLARPICSKCSRNILPFHNKLETFLTLFFFFFLFFSFFFSQVSFFLFFLSFFLY